MHQRTVHHFAPGHSDVEGIADLLERGGGGEAERLRGILGGKGAGLHAMAARGFRVPCGFTLSTEWCASFHSAGRVLPAELREELSRAMAALESRTGRRLGAPERPLLVAVRSGAARSMPGMMETVLNVGSLEGILAAVERVFLSWESERADAYRRRKGLVGMRGTAVVVQEMCPAEQAGVAFTADPATGEPVITVEAVRGLGEALVSGDATPDRYRLRRPRLEALEERIQGDGPVLDAQRLREVASLALGVEQAFGHAVDVEWAVAGGEAFLLQARAITPASPAGEGAEAGGVPRDAIRARLRAEAERLGRGEDSSQAVERSRTALLVRHNLDQTLSHPTSMTWDLLGELFGPHGGYPGLYLDLGFRPSRAVLERGFLVVVCGRIFADPGRAAEPFYGTSVLRHDEEALRRRPDLLDEPPRTRDRSAAAPLELIRTLWRVARAQRRLPAIRRGFLARFLREILPPYQAWCRAKGEEDLAALDATALLDELDARAVAVCRRFPRQALKLSFLGAMAHAELRDLLERRLGEEDGAAASLVLSMSPEEDAVLELNRSLAALGRGDLTPESFLERHGHRAAGEMELARPRWREDPGALPELARSLGGGVDLEARTRERKRALDAEEQRAERAFRTAGGEAAVAELRALVAETRALLPWREAWKHHWMLGLDLVRRVLLELDGRLGLEGGVFHLRRDELRALVAGGGAGPLHRELIRARREAERVDRAIRLPDCITAEDLERLADGRPLRAAEGLSEAAVLRGEPISPGQAEGRAWIATRPGEATAATPPFVLVCPSTDPAWTPLIARASAVVVERGGTLSHGAIVCRDFGVPAVVLPGATGLLSAGEIVSIDGAAGLITRPAASEPDGARRRAEHGAPPGLPAEPYVPAARPALARRALGGLAVAVAASVLLATLPAARSALQPALRAAFDWTIEAGWTPWGSIAFAASAAAILAALVQLAAGDRLLLRRLRERLVWYRRRLRAARASGAAGAVATLERRRRQASLERGLELLRPAAWSFLPFCLALLWVMDRFAAEPIRPGTTFTVRAVFRPAPGAPRLRRARLDAGVAGRARSLDAPWRQLEPNTEDPALGPYHIRWSLEALAEGLLPLAVATRDERLEGSVLITRRREIEPAETRRHRHADAAGGPEIVALEVEHTPVLVEPPGPAFALLDGFAKLLTGGRGITPRQAALGPITTFLWCSVLAALLMQRLTGMR